MAVKTNSLNVLMLADAVFEDIPGGSRVVARELARGLVARGHHVTFLVARHSPDAPDDETLDGIRIVRYAGAGQGRAFVQAGRAACAKLVSETVFDVVHTHFAYAAVGPLRAVPRTVPRIRTFHGPWDEEGWVEAQDKAISCAGRVKEMIKKRLRYQIERSNLRDSHRVIVLSNCFGRDVTERFHIPAARVHKIVGGVDVERFQLTTERPGVRRALGLPEDRRILLSVRRLAPRMGLANLIQAMPPLVARHPDLLLLIGGKGPEREALEHLIQKIGLSNHVQMAGFIPDEQLASYYQAADLFVLPTLALEGFGLVTVEALACGTPVIGTPVGATPEILRRLDERLIFSDTSPEAIAAGVEGYLSQGGQWSLTPNRLHQFVCDNFSWSDHVACVEQIYHQLMASADKP